MLKIISGLRNKGKFEPVSLWLQHCSVILRRELENNSVPTHFLTRATCNQCSVWGYGNSEQHS